MGSHLRFSRWNIAFGILSLIPQHSPVFVSVIILTNNEEEDNKPLEESCKAIYDEYVQAAKLGPDKRPCNRIFVIVSY